MRREAPKRGPLLWRSRRQLGGAAALTGGPLLPQQREQSDASRTSGLAGVSVAHRSTSLPVERFKLLRRVLAVDVSCSARARVSPADPAGRHRPALALRLSSRHVHTAVACNGIACASRSACALVARRARGASLGAHAHAFSGSRIRLIFEISTRAYNARVRARARTYTHACITIYNQCIRERHIATRGTAAQWPWCRS